MKRCGLALAGLVIGVLPALAEVSHPTADGRTGLVLKLPGGAEMELVLIPAGEFLMGATKGDLPAGVWEYPQHRVEIEKPFYMSKYEVTQEQWQAVMGSNPSHFKGEANLPVEMVSWNKAQEFCRKMSEAVNRVIRLPSEEEWEYASRSGSKGTFCFGEDLSKLGDYCWYRVNADLKTHPVGLKKPNAWGLYDMHGNVREWCEDWYDPYPGSTMKDEEFIPRQRILRGGSWDWVEAPNQGSPRRDRAVPDGARDHYGLRVVARVPPSEAGEK